MRTMSCQPSVVEETWMSLQSSVMGDVQCERLSVIYHYLLPCLMYTIIYCHVRCTRLFITMFDVYDYLFPCWMYTFYVYIHFLHMISGEIEVNSGPTEEVFSICSFNH